MIKLNLNLKISDGNNNFIKEQDGKEITFASFLANKLLFSVEKNLHKVEKYFNWAMSLIKKGFIEIDNVDLKMLIDFVEKQDLIILIKVPLLNLLNSKEEKKKI